MAAINHNRANHAETQYYCLRKDDKKLIQTAQARIGQARLGQASELKLLLYRVLHCVAHTEQIRFRVSAYFRANKMAQFKHEFTNVAVMNNFEFGSSRIKRRAKLRRCYEKS